MGILFLLMDILFLLWVLDESFQFFSLLATMLCVSLSNLILLWGWILLYLICSEISSWKDLNLIKCSLLSYWNDNMDDILHSVIMIHYTYWCDGFWIIHIFMGGMLFFVIVNNLFNVSWIWFARILLMPFHANLWGQSMAILWFYFCINLLVHV